MASLREEMDDLLNRFSLSWDGGREMSLTNAPSLDISETDKDIQLKIDVPGMKPNELEIEVSGDVVRITGEHKEEKEEKGRKFHRVERRVGSFERTVCLPCAVKEEKVNAEYHDGVLTVTLPKLEAAKTHKIPIKA